MEQEDKPVLKVEGEVNIKSSWREGETQIQRKKVVKWAAEGIHASMKIDGSSSLVHHLTSPLAELFPVLSVVKSGEITLKLKQTDNV